MPAPSQPTAPTPEGPPTLTMAHPLRGCHVRCGAVPPDAVWTHVLERLNLPDLHDYAQVRQATDAQGHYVALTLQPTRAQQWAPKLDTLGLTQTLQLDTHAQEHDLLREIVVAMLLGPIAFEFPSVDEMVSAVRIRVNIVHAARKTTLAFETSTAERPEAFWHYDEDAGFVIRPGVSLVQALVHATQPAISGSLYSFSCYRASEYVLLLGIAQELEQCNPALYAQLQTLWATHPIKSGKFHDVFLHEQGSMENPLPPHYFVPGDRTWFRNPDEASAEASGFEGSWVMYLGGGLFSNFWKRDQAFTLVDKCLEIYHWRHGLYIDSAGEERINEDIVAQRVQTSRETPGEVERICTLMERYREPRGVYTDAGGCIDTTREFARWVRPGTSNMVLPRA